MTDPERQPRRWTSTEDQILREHVDQQAKGRGKDWCRVALALPGRTNKDCRKRWQNSVAEGIKKGQWSQSEDQLLTSGVHRYGSQWTKVATCISSRSADQCAKRWQQSLDPRLDRSEWREDEDSALVTAVSRLGRHWKDVQQHYLPHRSKNCIKNRYSVLARRTASQLALYEENLESSSSDSGTPRQMVDDVLQSTAPIPHPSHRQPLPYTPDASYNTSNDESPWTWSALDTSTVSPNTNYCEPLHMHDWTVQYDHRSNFIYPTLHDNGHHILATAGLQHPSRFPEAYLMTDQSCIKSLAQRQRVPGTPVYMSSVTQLDDSNATLSAEFAWSGYQYSDVVPFGYGA